MTPWDVWVATDSVSNLLVTHNFFGNLGVSHPEIYDAGSNATF